MYAEGKSTKSLKYEVIKNWFLRMPILCSDFILKHQLSTKANTSAHFLPADSENATNLQENFC